MTLELKHLNYECWLYRDETRNLLKYITYHNFELREYLMCNDKKNNELTHYLDPLPFFI